MASDSGKVSTGSWGKARAIVDITDQTSSTSKVRVRYILYNESPSSGSYLGRETSWAIRGTGSLDATGTYTFNIGPGKSDTVVSKTFTYTHRSDGTAANLSFAVNLADTGTSTFGNPPELTVDITPPRIKKEPDAPKGLTVSNLGATSLKLSWSAPEDNGGASITNYRVTRQSVTEGSALINTGTSRSVTVSGLTRGGRYTFSVSAENSVGFSSPSNSVTVVMLDTPSAPGVPSLSNVTSTSLSATWSAPGDNGGTSITNYGLRRYTGSSATGTFVSDNANSLSRTVTGLTPGTTYTFTTIAQNAVGWGAQSAGRTVTLTKRPGSPTGLTISAVGPTDLTLSWTAPSSNGGSGITGYRVYRYSGTSASGSAVTTDTSSTSLRVTGLSPGQAYTFTVLAKNSATDNGGYSNASSPATQRTLAGVRVRVSGTWRLAVPYVRRNGVWTPAIPYVRTAGVWKITT